MTLDCFISSSVTAVPICFVSGDNYPAWLDKQTPRVKTWVLTTDFKAQTGNICLIPDSNGQLECVIAGVSDWHDIWLAGGLPKILPATHSYKFTDDLKSTQQKQFALAWGLGSYHYQRYKKPDHALPKLALAASSQETAAILQAIYKVRDLINTPTEAMGPADLASAAQTLAEEYQAEFKQWCGKELLQANFPVIHLVGRASSQEPRLIELQWAPSSLTSKQLPQLVLVGKGVCFDSGGLDIKQSHMMRLMKKDMGGAAHVLGLAQLIMQHQLPVRLRVLIPAVENAISGNAFRPGDIVRSRQGLTIEIGNTDAEGRLILADALSYGCEQDPDLIIDFATLTGAARIALGTDVAVMFCNDEQLSRDLIASSQLTSDPIWPLPLYQPYRKLIDSPIADIDNSGSSTYGGAITAALFLQEFIKKKIPWVHFDIMAWNVTNRPGRPEGGEAMALRAVFHYLQQRYQIN